MPKYVKLSYITKNYQVSPQTLRVWADTGKVKSIKNPNSRHRLIEYDSFLKYVGATSETDTEIKRQRICYARVSSSHQKQDLKRQIDYLKYKFPDHKIIKDIGSGLNWKRKGLQTILEQLFEGHIEQIVVTHTDRLSRFGFELLQWLCKKFNCTIVVLNESTETNPEIELSQDVLSIITYFTAKNNGMRASKNRKDRDSKIKKDKALSNNTPKKDS